MFKLIKQDFRIFLELPQENENKPLGMEVFYGPLIVWVLGLLIGSLVFFIELSRKQKKEPEPTNIEEEET